MKTKLFLLTSALFLSAQIYSQVGINTPTPSSTLDVRGGIEGNFREITLSDALGAKDYHVSFSGTANSSLSIPAVSAADGSATDFTGRKYYVKNNSTTSTLTLTAASGQTLRLGSNIANGNTYVLKPGRLAVLTANGISGWDVSTDTYVAIVDSYANGPKLAAQLLPAGGAFYTLNDSQITLNVLTANTKVYLYFAGLGTSGGAPNSLGSVRFQIVQTGTATVTYPSVSIISFYNSSGNTPVAFSFKAGYSITNLAPGTYTFSLQARREAEAGSLSDVTIWSSGGTAQVYYK